VLLRFARVPADLAALIRSHHDELDRGLVALLESSTTSGDIAPLLDAIRIGLGAHMVAQSAVLGELLGPVASSRVVTELVRSTLDEHRKQARDLATLASLRIGSSTWHDAVLELRIAMLNHGAREEFIGATLFDHVAPARRHAFARTYATERLRRFAHLDMRTTEPAALQAFALS